MQKITRKNNLLVFFGIFLVGLLFVPLSMSPILAQDSVIPAWIKNNAGWWATGVISETEFVNAIEFLIKENIIQVNASQTSETSQGVPGWVKNTAGWWATDVISETEFVNAIEFLIKNGIINIESTKSPESIAEMWVNGDINDDEFLVNVDQMIENDVITVQSDSITKTSQLPDWLVNNAGWWAARIFTNSDFDFDPGYVKEKIFPCDEWTNAYGCIPITYNSYGYRGNEFEKEKSDNTFRIFTVGGSTTFGIGVADDETWPAHLQLIVDEKITDKKIEVINFAINMAGAEIEYSAIKNDIIPLEPDLVIMFDGWNEKHKPIEESIGVWESACKLGKNEGFDVIIVIQPLPTIGQRVLTDQETTNASTNPYLLFSYLERSQQYVNAFEELDEVCTKTADFRRIFDYVQEPVFYDYGHTVSFGNKMIAENVFSVISPIYFGQTYSVIHNNLEFFNNSEPGTSVVYAVGSDLSGKNFDNLNLQNAVFDNANLSNTSFKNANIDGARFVFANLDNSNLFERTDLSNINLAGADLSNMNLKGKNLTDTVLTVANFTDTTLTGVDLSGANLSFVDLSKNDLTGTSLSDAILYRTNLSGMDLRDIILDNANFRYTILSESKLPDSPLVNNNFDYALLDNINFAGKNLSGSSFHFVKLDGSDMQNTDLRKAKFVQVDFTKAKNKSLVGADLSEASFAHANLSGVNLSDVILKYTNFWNADLSGVDFTVTDSVTEGMTFIESNLYNANFEGVNLSPKQQYTTIFKDKAYLISDEAQSAEAEKNIWENLFDVVNLGHILITSTEARGNDLAVNYISFNSFSKADLKNANFKNASLWNVNFYLADLANADLSGADLRNAFLSEADLSNANLDGANLDGALLDNAILTGANLKCINHPICD